MFWRPSGIVKGTSSIWSVMFSVLFCIAIVWGIATNIQDRTWRLLVEVGGTVICLVFPNGRASVRWLFSSRFRKQWKDYRRGGLLPGYSPDAPWEGSKYGLGKSLQEKTDFYLSKNTILGSHSESFQSELKDQMYQSVAEIFAADNPLLKCREKLAGYVVSFADFQVLCLKPEEKDEQHPSYVSGELHRHIRYCAQYNRELADFISRNKDFTDDDLIMWANARSCAFLYLMNCMNNVRADVNDVDLSTATKTDWFQPFVKSMLVWKEDDYRSKIGLPSLLRGDLRRLHATFLTYVLNGVRNPLFHWEART